MRRSLIRCRPLSSPSSSPSSSSASTLSKSPPPNLSALLEETLARVRQGGTASTQGANIIAYSGGVDSSLVAALVQRVFPQNSFACIGLSASLPREQLALARKVASHIGIPLKEVMTSEGDAPEYVANRGLSCFHCKTHLYTALQAVVGEAQRVTSLTSQDHTQTSTSTPTHTHITLFNGTNADDRQDPTRVGLKAAHNFRVRSPIDHLNKQEVRALAQLLGLPNWQHAASPCLRSRLALGVPAVEEHLKKVENAERLVREMLKGKVGVQHNLRVRLLAGGRAAVEVDEELLEEVAGFGVEMEKRMQDLFGFASVGVRVFKSGSVSGGGVGGGKKKKEEENGEKGEQGEGVVVTRSSRGRDGRQQQEEEVGEEAAAATATAAAATTM